MKVEVAPEDAAGALGCVAPKANVDDGAASEEVFEAPKVKVLEDVEVDVVEAGLLVVAPKPPKVGALSDLVAAPNENPANKNAVTIFKGYFFKIMYSHLSNKPT